MKFTVNDDFDLKKIAESGQCFRWEKLAEEDSYRIIASDRCLTVREGENPGSVSDRGAAEYADSGKIRETGSEIGRNREVVLDLDCGQAEFDAFWYPYFDLDTCYRDIRGRINPGEDAFLAEAAQAEQGIRILRQDSWEALISFIISQNRNIPAIRRSIEMLCTAAGKKMADSHGVEYYAFPTPKQICEMSEQELKDCRLGYRWKYVQSAARDISSGRIDLDGLKQCAASGQTAPVIQTLTSIYGVGVKVASCAALFGFHCTDALPIDVWMKRVMTQEYPQGYPYEKYSPYNGIYQQYMFAYYRKNGARSKIDKYPQL